MVKKERKLLTHIVLILVCFVVLFPIVWVVSTSLRRDNAAFSTKLFSTRLTLQNYIDLLAPEKNGPRLVSDIDALVLMAPPHENISIEQAKKLFASDIERFKKYINETENLKKRVDSEIKFLKDYFEKNSGKLTEKFIRDVENIISLLKFQKPDRYLNVAAYDLQTSGFELEPLGNLVSPADGESEWYNMIGTRKEKLNNLKTELANLESELQPIEKTYYSLLAQFRTQYKTIENLLLPQLEEYTRALAVAEELLDRSAKSELIAESIPDENSIREHFVTALSQLAELQLQIERYEPLQKVVDTLKKFQETYRNILKKWENNLGNQTTIYADFLNMIETFTIRVSSTIKESASLIRRLDITTARLLNVQRQQESLKSRIQSVRSQMEKVELELSRAYEELKPAIVYLRSELLKKALAEIKDKVKDLKLPDQLQVFNLQSRKVFGLVTDFAALLPDGSKEQKALRNSVRNIDWPGIARDIFNNYELFSENYEPFIKDLKNYLAQVEQIGPKFMPTSKSGIKVRPVALEGLIDTVLSTYRNNVVPNMNVMSRKASELSDKLKIKELSSSLKSIDAATFRIDQIWQRKPDHYLLRWIMNSVIVSLSVAVIITVVTALAAYPFSRMRFKGRKYGIMSLLLIQMFPAIMYMIAIYTFLSFAGKYIPGFGLNKLSGLIFAYLGGIAYNMYLIKGYYDTIPDSLEEAAMIDGATRWQTFVKIVLPLASPILAVIVILTFMSTFNEFVLARIILQDVKQYTYAIGLYTFSTGPFETQWGLFTAAALIGMVPMVILFLLMQKYIVGGLVKGAVKG
ncbi:ABC transporter permease subunit [Fervidobacterium thailandense]|uniref:ABC transporter permease n=1 Tax=Fervidobacterium thailandense TaxID=1008305 RepID=A0A1E3G270_9BACT|nr:ABC transporter permease subunit [Fervidobacterium thailandense]ODN30292.1 ABC transporter permease [Fervidobacterium thailandense]